MSTPMPAPMPPANPATTLNLLNAGLAITSTSTPALNGTYECQGWGLEALQAEMDSLTRNSGAFVDGTTSVNWPDKTGAGHTFTVAQFGELTNTINRFLVECYQYSKGLTATPPSGSATIA